MSGLDISPDLDPQEALSHYGIPGMKWGVSNRKASGSSSGSEPHHGLTDHQKTALKVGGGVLAVGAVIGIAVLAKNGNIPVGQLTSSARSVARSVDAAAMRGKADQAARQALVKSMQNAGKIKDTAEKVKSAADTVSQGKAAVDQLRASDMWQKQVASMQSDIDQGHRDQNRYMTNTMSSGYNAGRDNPYSPEARALAARRR